MNKLFLLKNIKKILLLSWPIFFLVFIILLFFYPYWLRGLVPIPLDFVVGVYFPWLDYKWAGYDAGVPVKNPLIADVPSLMFPLKLYAVELFKGGIFPLWNPLAFGGYPLLANFQSGIFNPLNIIYILADAVTAWSLQVILQPVVSALFMYVFLRHLVISKVASLLGAFAYSFSGFNIIWLEYNIHGHVAALIPLLLFLADKFILSGNIAYGVGFSVILAVQIFAGYPQLTFYSLILIFLWLTFRAQAKLWDKRILKYIVMLGGFSFLGLGLSAIQLLPGFELLKFSQRVSEGLVFELQYLPFQQLVNILAPDFFGNPASQNYWGPGNYTSNVGYSGLVTFILASLSFTILRKNKITLFFILVAFFTLLISLPTPIGLFFHSTFVPGSDAASSTRILVIFNLSLAVLASLGFDWYRKERDLKVAVRALYLPSIIIIGVGLGTLFVWKFLNIYNQNFIDTYKPQVLMETINNLKVGIRNLILPIGLLISTGLILLLWAKEKRLGRFCSLCILILLVFELFRFGWKFTPFSERTFAFPETPIFQFLTSQEKPFRIVGGEVLPISMWIPFRLESLSGYDAVYPSRIAKLISVINTSNPKAGPMGRYGNVEGYNNKLFDLTNNKYILDIKRNERGESDVNGKISYKVDISKLEEVFEDKSVAVLENKKSLPRAFFVTQWEMIQNEESILERLLEEEFPLDKKIILENDYLDFPQIENNFATVKYLKYNANRSLINVTTENSGLLFISDTWYPGWKAFVDGKQTEILRANYAFRAIPVEKGVHEVLMSYEPSSFQIGKFMSLFSLGILTVITIVSLTIKRKNYA